MSLVQYSLAMESVGLITLNDPNNLNAMGEDMAKEFRELVGTLHSKKLRALILTGAGKAFSAGGHLEMLLNKTTLSAEENRLRMLDFYDSFLSILKLEVPVIAAINGAAIGAGLCLACACDIRIASEEAKMGFTFSRLGLHPGMGATYFVPKTVGSTIARELILTGRIIGAAESLNLGLVSKVVGVKDLMEDAKHIAIEILKCGPIATSQVLKSLREPEPNLASALNREALFQSVNYASPEFKEGVNAMIEKRKPSWSPH